MVDVLLIARANVKKDIVGIPREFFSYEAAERLRAKKSQQRCQVDLEMGLSRINHLYNVADGLDITYAWKEQPQDKKRTSQPPYPHREHRVYSSLFDWILFIVEVIVVLIVFDPNKTPGLEVIPPPMSMSSVSKLDIIIIKNVLSYSNCENCVCREMGYGGCWHFSKIMFPSIIQAERTMMLLFPSEQNFTRCWKFEIVESSIP